MLPVLLVRPPLPLPPPPAPVDEMGRCVDKDVDEPIAEFGVDEPLVDGGLVVGVVVVAVLGVTVEETLMDVLDAHIV